MNELTTELTTELKTEKISGRKKTLSISIDLDTDIFSENNDSQEKSNDAYYRPGSVTNEINKITERNFMNLTKIQPEIYTIVNEIILKMSIPVDKNNKDIMVLNRDFQNYSCYIQNGKKRLVGINNQKCSVNGGVFINGSKVLKLYNYEKQDNEWVKYKYMREVALQQYAHQIMNRTENVLNRLNIPMIFNYGEYDIEDKSYFFIIMEFVSGIHLGIKTKINDNITRHILEGINLLLTYKLSHKDLRNTNIIFDKKNNIITLIDFGEAILKNNAINEPYICNFGYETYF